GVDDRYVPVGGAVAVEIRPRRGLVGLGEQLVRVLQHARTDRALNGLAEDGLLAQRLGDVHLAARVVQLDALGEPRIAVGPELPNPQLIEPRLLLILRQVQERPGDQKLLLLPPDLWI